jgi:hypothetical protein
LPSQSGLKPTCKDAWSAYGTLALPPDARFAVSKFAKFDVTGADGLDHVRSMIASGVTLAYGTALYNDFPSYHGTPRPYVGEKGKKRWRMKKANSQQYAGHCMMIIGYDDSLGAVLIQNGFGPKWGSEWNGKGGYIWIAYETFQAMAKGPPADTNHCGFAFYLITK